MITRILSCIIGFVLVRVSVIELGESNYGLWIGLYSIAGWFLVLDMGLPNVLRNVVSKLSQAEKRSKGGFLLIQVITKLVKIVSPIVLIILAVLFICDFCPENIEKETFGILSTLVAVGIITTIVNRTIVCHYLGLGIHWIEGFNGFLISLIVILVVFGFSLSLTQYALITVLAPLLVGGVFLALLFKNGSLMTWKSKTSDKISLKNKNSRSFLIIQIGAIVVFSTDYFLILILFEGESVWIYHTITKYYSLLTIIGGSLAAPIWSKISSRANDTRSFHFKEVVYPQLLAVLLLIGLGFLMFLFEGEALAFWLDDHDFDTPGYLSYVILGNALVAIFVAPFVMIINGLEFLFLQKTTAIISMLLNIPLSIIFAQKWGLVGVPLATLLCYSYGIILRPLQVYFISMGRKGIWTKP